VDLGCIFSVVKKPKKSHKDEIVGKRILVQAKKLVTNVICQLIPYIEFQTTNL
jgi:hypothetical protein